MAVAMIFPEPKPGQRTDLLKNSTGSDVETSYLSRARTVLRWAQEMAPYGYIPYKRTVDGAGDCGIG